MFISYFLLLAVSLHLICKLNNRVLHNTKLTFHVVLPRWLVLRVCLRSAEITPQRRQRRPEFLWDAEIRYEDVDLECVSRDYLQTTM